MTLARIAFWCSNLGLSFFKALNSWCRIYLSWRSESFVGFLRLCSLKVETMLIVWKSSFSHSHGKSPNDSNSLCLVEFIKEGIGESNRVAVCFPSSPRPSLVFGVCFPELLLHGQSREQPGQPADNFFVQGYNGEVGEHLLEDTGVENLGEFMNVEDVNFHAASILTLACMASSLSSWKKVFLSQPSVVVLLSVIDRSQSLAFRLPLSISIHGVITVARNLSKLLDALNWRSGGIW